MMLKFEQEKRLQELQAQKSQAQESVTLKTQSLSNQVSELSRQNRDLESLNQSFKKQLTESREKIEQIEKLVKDKNLKVQQLTDQIAQTPSQVSHSGLVHDSKEIQTLQKQMRCDF